MTAPEGLEAIKISDTFAPHIVILDVMMPGMDGFEVCQALKEKKPVSVIMLTAKEETEDRVKGLTLGADDYMSKPFSFGELLARIQARIRNQFPRTVLSRCCTQGASISQSCSGFISYGIRVA
jgi:two-component system OmpR family response regulator